MSAETKSSPRRAPTRRADSVERVYRALKDLAVNYHFRPGAKVNEVDLARRLNVSRTPVREAINRLVQDGFMTFTPNKGFFAREISPAQVRDLYELRAGIEVTAVRLACRRAEEADITALAQSWTRAIDASGDYDFDLIADADEAFHLRIAELSANQQIVQALDAINAQIRMFRRVDQESRGRRGDTQREHLDLLTALAERDAERAAATMEKHVTLSSDHAMTVSKEVLARIYLR